MWSNLSSLAQKAKEAASLIEGQINDALNEGDFPDDGDERTSRGGDGWEKCGDIKDEEAEKVDPPTQAPSSGMSFVDLAAQDIPKNGSGEPETDAALLDALARVEVLEKQVNALKDELAAAREESENYHQTNLLLEQQVKELTEENRALKEEGGGNDE